MASVGYRRQLLLHTRPDVRGWLQEFLRMSMEMLSHMGGQWIKCCCVLLLAAGCHQHICPTFFEVSSACVDGSVYVPKLVVMLWVSVVGQAPGLAFHAMACSRSQRSRNLPIGRVTLPKSVILDQP